jgi:hypothetical protein
MTISIHQPNFVPRMSYFQKIQESDLFVIMTQCQYEKGGFQNRFNVGDRFFGMAVNKGTGRIWDKRYNNPTRDWGKITSVFPKLERFDNCIYPEVGDTNSNIIVEACWYFKIVTKIEYDCPTNLTGTARLVDICKAHGATKYLSGISGKNYLDLKLFDQAGIEVIFQDESKMDKRALVEVL